MLRPRLNIQGSLSGMVVLLAAIPLLFVMLNSVQLPLDKWLGLWNTRLPSLFWNTLLLAALVVIGCFILGVSSAWLIARRQFRGRSVALWLMILPLAIPTYVFAYIYTSLMDVDGWLGSLWITLFGNAASIPDLYNVGGVALILALSGFPYVFLLTHSALLNSNPHMEEAARIHGASSREIFWRITAPLIRPAIAASLAMVTLHVLSDFGAVSMLRYQTFTLSIYLQMNGRFDYQSAAALSSILVMLALTFLVLERFFRSRQRYFSANQAKTWRIKHASKKELWIIWSWLGLISLFAFILPLAWMLTWSFEAVIAQTLGSEFWGYALNSLVIAIIAATVCIVAALPIGLFHTRFRSWLSNLFLQMSSTGFVLPGPVVALGVMTFFLTTLPALYGTLAALTIALVIRFLPLAVQSQEAALSQLTPSIEQASRVHGAGPLETLWRITLPMMRNGMVAAWVLVFIDALKELPATLLLRPIGFDTLPVRIWIEASEEMLEVAAPAALMLVISTIPALWIMLRSTRQST